MKITAPLLAGLALVSASDVVKLTSETFDDFLATNKLVIAEFFAPWCGHCKALEPEYEKAATELKSHDIAVAKIDCTEEQELCSDHDVHGFPTLKVFKSADKVDKYEGPRTSEGIVQFMVSRSLPPLIPVGDKKALEAFLDGRDVAAIAYSEDQETEDTLTSVAENFRDRFGFATVKKVSLASEYGLEKPGFVLIKADEEPVLYDGEFDVASITEFLNVESFPTFGEIGPGNYGHYVQSGVPLLFAFVENTEQREKLTEYLVPQVKTLKGRANIVFLDTELFGGHAENVNLRPEFPALVVHDIKTNKKYIHSQDTEITAESVAEFAKGYADGTLPANVKSEDIPESQDNAVYTLVGKEYDAIVLDNDKDVLVEYYAPWCGHCKNLAPTYEELAESYSSVPEVVVAKLDHTLNEVPDQIQGYPTIKLYPAGAKDKPITYEGARGLEDLIKFIREKGTHGKDATVKPKPESAADSASSAKVEENAVPPPAKREAPPAPEKTAAAPSSDAGPSAVDAALAKIGQVYNILSREVTFHIQGLVARLGRN